MTLTPQYSQLGARAWTAHSKLSKVCESPPGIVTWKALSYSFPQTSHWAISILLSRSGAIPHLQSNYPDHGRDKRERSDGGGTRRGNSFREHPPSRQLGE